MRYFLATFAGALSLSACATPRIPAGDAVPLEQVIRQIKNDIGQYNGYALKAAKENPLDNICKGKIDLTIKTVTVSTTTVTKTNEGGTLGAEISPNAVLKLGASGGLGSSRENSQVLTFTLVPVPARDLVVSGEGSNLYLALKNLRESLLAAGDAEPCLRFPPGDQENTLVFGFTASRSATTSAGINLFIFAIGYSRGSERTAAHTITIGFEGQGQAIQ